MADVTIQNAGELPPMGQSLDLPLAMPELDTVQDVQVVSRDFGDNKGSFAALHNMHLSKSIMTGTFTSASSSAGVTRYEGTFLNDPHHETPTPSGQGVRTNPDGSVYAGQWRDGRPDGHGEMTAPPPSCESYVGEFRRGRKHGLGLQKFANGDTYEGDWVEGKFHDRGKFVYANGDEFFGIFENGLKKQGTFYYKDGRVSARKWENGCLLSNQEFDARRRTYQPTLNRMMAHNPARNMLGSTESHFHVISPRGNKIN